MSTMIALTHKGSLSSGAIHDPFLGRDFPFPVSQAKAPAGVTITGISAVVPESTAVNLCAQGDPNWEYPPDIQQKAEVKKAEDAARRAAEEAARKEAAEAAEGEE